MKFIFCTIFTLLTLNASADVVRPLPKGDTLRGAATAIGNQLADGNISTGTTLLWAGQLKTKQIVQTYPEMETLVKLGFADAFRSRVGEDVPANSKLDIKINRFVDGSGKMGTVAAMTEAIMQSNDYNPANRELRKSQARYLWVVLRKLPVNSQTLVGHVTTRLRDDSSGELRVIQYFLLLNQSGKVIQLFTIEGSM